MQDKISLSLSLVLFSLFAFIPLILTCVSLSSIVLMRVGAGSLTCPKVDWLYNGVCFLKASPPPSGGDPTFNSPGRAEGGEVRSRNKTLLEVLRK